MDGIYREFNFNRRSGSSTTPLPPTSPFIDTNGKPIEEKKNYIVVMQTNNNVVFGAVGDIANDETVGLYQYNSN